MTELLHNPEIWVLIGFTLFVVLVFKPGKKALLGGIDGRVAKIRQQLDEAASLRREAEAALTAAQTRLADSAAEAERMIADAKAGAERSRREALEEIHELTQRRQKEAIEKIAQAEAGAVDEIRRLAVDAAIAATRSLLVSHVTGATADRLVDDAIADLPQRLN
jgi:F-type H+-transporting ATPase subunit b